MLSSVKATVRTETTHDKSEEQFSLGRKIITVSTHEKNVDLKTMTIFI